MHQIISKHKLTKAKKSGTYSRLLRKHQERFKKAPALATAEIDLENIEHISENNSSLGNVVEESNPVHNSANDDGEIRQNSGKFCLWVKKQL